MSSITDSARTTGEILRAPLPVRSHPVDQEVLRTLYLREAAMVVRSSGWARLLAWTGGGLLFLAIAPIIYRTAPGHWSHPTGLLWFQVWMFAGAVLWGFLIGTWTSARLGATFRPERLQELQLTTSHPGDLFLGMALALGSAVLLLATAALPGLLLIAAVGGVHAAAVLRAIVSLLLVGLTAHALGTATRTTGSWSNSILSWLGGALLLVFVLFIFGLNSDHRLAAPFFFLLKHNVAMLLLTTPGTRQQQWGISAGLQALFILGLYADIVRLSRQPWSVPETPRKEQFTQQQLWDAVFHANIARMTSDKLFKYPLLPGLAVDHAKFRREQMRLASVGFGIAFLFFSCRFSGLLSLFRSAPQISARRILVTLVCVATFYSCQDASRRVVETLRGAQWEEWRLLPLKSSDVAEWLSAVWKPSWYATVTLGGLILALMALLPRRPEIAGFCWLTVVTLGAAPAATIISTVVTLRARDAAGAQWRIFCFFTLFPLLAACGLPFGIRFGWIAAVSPMYSAIWFLCSGSLPLEAWVGVGLLTACGVAAWRRLHRVCEWPVSDI